MWLLLISSINVTQLPAQLRALCWAPAGTLPSRRQGGESRCNKSGAKWSRQGAQDDLLVVGGSTEQVILELALDFPKSIIKNKELQVKASSTGHGKDGPCGKETGRGSLGDFCGMLDVTGGQGWIWGRVARQTRVGFSQWPGEPSRSSDSVCFGDFRS